jgi:hypothetical protein
MARNTSNGSGLGSTGSLQTAFVRSVKPPYTMTSVRTPSQESLSPEGLADVEGIGFSYTETDEVESDE